MDCLLLSKLTMPRITHNMVYKGQPESTYGFLAFLKLYSYGTVIVVIVAVPYKPSLADFELSFISPDHVLAADLAPRSWYSIQKESGKGRSTRNGWSRCRSRRAVGTACRTSRAGAHTEQTRNGGEE